MQYKRITTKDVDEIMKLDVRLGSPWSKGLYMDRLSMFPDLAYGAFKNGKMIGFVLGKKDTFGNITLSRMAVRKELEGRGIGGHLVDMLIKKVDRNDIKELNATIRESNSRSLNLHKSRGFVENGLYTYRDGERGFKMIKRLR